MIVGYSLSVDDGDKYFFEAAPDTVFCPKCDSVIDDSYTPVTIGGLKKDLDCFSTYENRLIVSERFKAVCDRLNSNGLQFIQVNNAPILYWLKIIKSLEFDSIKRKTRFDGLCSLCNNYESIIGATPVYLKGVNYPIESGFYRTDLEFGSGREKSHLEIIGCETKNILERECLLGINYIPTTI